MASATPFAFCDNGAMQWYGPQAKLEISELPEEIVFTATTQAYKSNFVWAGLCFALAMVGLFVPHELERQEFFWIVGFAVFGFTFLLRNFNARVSSLHTTAKGFDSGAGFRDWGSLQGIAHRFASRNSPQGLYGNDRGNGFITIPLLLYANSSQCSTVLEAIYRKFPAVSDAIHAETLGETFRTARDAWNQQPK